MAVPTVITDLSTTIASNAPAGSESPASLDDYQRAHAGFIAQLYANTVAATTVIVASGASTAIGAAISENVDISGTTTITSFDTVAEGINRKGRFTGALTLTHNATSLILPGAANIITTANDRYEARSLGSGNWIVTKYVRANTAVGDASIGFKNKIIGGDFTVNPWQRGTSFAAVANGAYIADRWQIESVTAAVNTVSKATDGPTATQAGMFTQHCLSIACTTIDASIAAGDRFLFYQAIEGTNAASFGFGQSGTRYITVSFWVKGTKTGIHCVSLQNSDSSRSYVAEYTISVTNTWEYKTITIPVDTSGTWLYDSGTAGLCLTFTLISGATYQTTVNTWSAGNFFATSSQVNAMDSNTNVFKIALVQVEAGQVATAYDVRSIGSELALCNRHYFSADYAMTVTKAAPTQISSIFFRVPMAYAPTATYSGFVDNDASGATSITLNTITPYGADGWAVAGTTTVGSRLFITAKLSAEL